MKPNYLKLPLLLLFAIQVFLLHSQESEDPSSKAMIMQNGSVFKGEVIAEDEYYITFLSSYGDTLRYSYKEVKEVVDMKENDILFRREGKQIQKSYFINLDIIANPLGIQFGWRPKEKSWMIGPAFQLIGALSGEQVFHTGLYLKHILKQKVARLSFYGDLQFGVRFGDLPFRESNIQEYLNPGIGLMIEMGRNVHYYFDAGVIVISKREGAENLIDFEPQVTLFGLQF